MTERINKRVKKSDKFFPDFITLIAPAFKISRQSDRTIAEINDGLSRFSLVPVARNQFGS